jgi:hypothetical protein
MTTPSSFPWVNYKSIYVSGVRSTPTIIIGTDTYVNIVKNINVCNTSKEDIFVNFYLLRVDQANSFSKFNHLINKNTSQDILNITTINGVPAPSSSELTIMPGDILYGYTDSFDHTFDGQISYCELLESS